MSRHQNKAIQYIQQLNDARCDGNWEAVPELVRKVRKHAPERSCLTLAAESEYAVTQASKVSRPSTALSTKSSALLPLITPLLEAIETEKTYVEDEFQARICLGWIHFMLDEPTLVVARLPKNIDHDFAELDGTGKESAGWTKVCAVKGTYLKGASHAKLGSDAEALSAYDAGMPILSLEESNAGHELRTWTEVLLSNACFLYSKTFAFKWSRLLEAETLSAFRLWAKFWETGHDSIPGGFGVQSKLPRRHIWRQYYLTLSSVLQKGQPYPTSSLITAYVDDSAKVRQRVELEKVQTIYESLILKEIPFPKAEEASEEVEQWVEVVVQNWSVLCGNNWDEDELAPGGREAIGRRVLEILYRAATKTFHSTPILRYLFVVHLAVADFDLAFKAFDTYLDIVKKGKAREEKMGEIENALDEDETILLTTTDCIRALCRYGSRHGAEKAREVATYIEDWLKKYGHADLQVNGNKPIQGQVPQDKIKPTVSTNTISKAWLSVGISQAQWARFTYESTARSDIQKRAVDSFRKALSFSPKEIVQVEILFALGTLLAERRELDSAIEVVKSALLPSGPSPDATHRNMGPWSEFSKERSLIPLWHLLALLLSARQEFTTAARSCEGAFEQFKDPTNLFGRSVADPTYRSDHLNEKSRSQLGVVDIMEDFEKETILEVKITQLALIEILEGPEIAVNASDELLSLYARLFGEPDKTLSTVTPKAVNEPPPRSSAGTIRTIGGNIFGRSHRSHRRHSKTTINEKGEGPVALARPKTTANLAPAIEVTNEIGSIARQPSQSTTRERSTHRQEKLHKIRNRSSSVSKHVPPRTSITAESSTPSSIYFTPPNSADPRDHFPDRPSMIGVAISSGHAYPEGSNISSGASQKSHTERPVNNGNKQQDIKSHSVPFMNPATRLSQRQERRRRLGILVRLWLLVAGFYRRATMLEDAKGALEEARKLVEVLEADVSQDESGDVSISNSGWGGGKSVEELWGDVWAERGHLSLAKGLLQNAHSDFEAGLTNFPDHPLATIGLCNLLLDTYAEASISSTTKSTSSSQSNQAPSNHVNSNVDPTSQQSAIYSQLPIHSSPLGLPTAKNASKAPVKPKNTTESNPNATASSTALLDRLAARDRAYGLLSALTKSGKGWNDSEAWFALARAYEEGGEIDKSRECLWWCIELEEAKGVRGWDCVAVGGYVL